MATLNQILQATGQFPRISIKMIPLDRTRFVNAQYGQDITEFLEYQFRASVVTPVADFSFTFAMPSQPYAFSEYIKEGDIIILFISIDDVEVPLSTGIIDTIETQVTPTGETVSVMGRDLLGQWEDQGVFTPDGVGIFAAQMTPQQVFNNLALNTRSQRMALQNIPDTGNYIGMAPMESKLQVAIRYLEPYNALIWCAPDGSQIWGKPNMSQPVSGQIVMNRSAGVSNCISMRSTRSAATIPNFILPILSTQTNALNQLSKKAGIANPQPGPKRLAALGHYLHRVYVSSLPSGDLGQQLNAVQSLTLFGNPVDVSTAMAMREMARENMKEVLIQALVPGHLNEQGNPYKIDQKYHVVFDRDGIEEDMYLYDCDYKLSEKDGPQTLLMFTRLNTIVAGNNFQ